MSSGSTTLDTRTKRQTITVRATPDLDDAEVVIDNCPHGRKKRTMIVPRWTLKTAARNIMGMSEAIDEAREREAREGNSSWMGSRASTLSFGLGHFLVEGYGPNRSARPEDHEAQTLRAKLCVRIWFKGRMPALDVLLTQEEARELTRILWDASQPPGLIAFEWTET